MNWRIILFGLFSIVFLSTPNSWAQIPVLDDVRRDILDESKEEIEAINEEIKRQKKLKEEETKKKKQAYAERIKRKKMITAIEKQREIVSESEELLDALKERTKFKTDKRWRYEEMIKIYAEKPIEEMSLEEQKETANQLLASATVELVGLLKQKAIEAAKMKRGEEYEEIIADEELLVQLNQYTQLVKRIESYKGAQQEQIVQKKEDVVRSTQELIDLFKEEAIQRAELKRVKGQEEIDKQRMSFNIFEGTLGLHYGYDNNVNADKAFKGGLFVRNYFSLDWLPSFNQYFNGNLGIWHLADNHLDYQDVTFKITAAKSSLKWHPLGNEKLVIEPGFEFINTYYPNNPTLSTNENRLFVNSKHKFWKNWSQELKFQDLRTSNNDNRLARDGAGDDKPGVDLEKHKQSIEYNLGFPLPFKATFKLKNKATLQSSNDAFTDFYDYNSYKIRGELGRKLTKKLYAKANISYEQKDYTQRTVDAHQVAQEDRTYTQKFTLFYFWAEDWLVNYTWTRTKVDSNDPLFDYDKMTHLVGLYYSF